MIDNLKALWAKIKAVASDLWSKYNIFLIIPAAILLIIKYRDLIIDILLNSSKRVEDKAKKEDSKLATEENQAKTQADELVKKAAEEPSKEQPVSEDWYLKK